MQIGKGIYLSVNDCMVMLASCSITPSSSSKQAVARAHHLLSHKIDAREVIYGINTQFGDQVCHIEPLLQYGSKQEYGQALVKRQNSLVRSLIAGTGAPVSEQAVRLTMLLRAHCLAQGCSGVRQDLIDKMLEWVNLGAAPEVYRYGSIGASGDLIPLATIAGAVIGEPVAVNYKGKRFEAGDFDEITAFNLQNREGLALVNGTSFMTAIATISFAKLERIFKQLLAVIGMVLEVMQVNVDAYDPWLHQIKHHFGAVAVSHFLQPFWVHSDVVNVDGPKQDCYSMRAVCQGFGPFYEHMQAAKTTLEHEINSINDNPVIDPDTKKILHGANFMGYYICDICDHLNMDIGQAASWVHALLANLLHPDKSRGLPTNLMPDPAQNNGLRSLQILAAALAVECRKNCQGHGAFMLPTEGHNQDVNSLGTHAALDFADSVDHLERLTAILYLSACQAFDLRGLDKITPVSKEWYQRLRQVVPYHQQDIAWQPLVDQALAVLSDSDDLTLG